MKEPNSYFKIAGLVSKFLEGRLSKSEAEKLNAWIAEKEEHRQLWEKWTDSEYLEKKLTHWDNNKPDIYWKQLKKELSDKPVRFRIMVKKAMRYAAVLLPLIMIAGIGWFLLGQHEHKKSVGESTSLASVHILPKGNVAQLVLGNGNVIQLTDSLQKAIIEKDGTKVNNKGKALHYIAGTREAEVIYNTLKTPRGGEYQVVLADGTKVWLNAASSIRFPTQFNGENRKIYLSGEAYFEVAKDAHRPFIVNTGKSDITVLGTKFNVSAYKEDDVETTTLAEGAVRVTPISLEEAAGQAGVRLQPGYEAAIAGENNTIQVNKADINAALAWKNGLFIFDGQTLSHIMKNLSRWYDVDIIYEKNVDTLLHFTGRIRKYGDITGILEKLEMTKKVQFNIQGHQVQVLPYIK